MLYTNPWKDAKGFIELGATMLPNEKKPQTYELYAIVNNKESISFGARFSNTPEDYISGGACKLDEWETYGGFIICIAAAKFFANHHPDLPDK